MHTHFNLGTLGAPQGRGSPLHSLGDILQRAIKLTLTVILAVIAAVYVATALSSLPRQIARSSPERASMFRPPSFNFFAKYDEGRVLGFEIGSAREQLTGTLVAKYRTTGLLQATCGREDGAPPLTVAESDVPVGDPAVVREFISREVSCLWLPARRIMLIFWFQDGRLREVELSFVRNELTF